VKILLVEDDKQTAEYIAKGLREHGHVVDRADNGRDGLYLATGERYDVMIIDRNLPRMDGLSLVKAARTSGTTTPALFLTTMGGVDDRVEGLEAGADDYLVKPFAFAELLARVSALARRPPIAAMTSLKVGDLEIDLLSRAVARAVADEELGRDLRIRKNLRRQGTAIGGSWQRIFGRFSYDRLFFSQANVFPAPGWDINYAQNVTNGRNILLADDLTLNSSTTLQLRYSFGFHLRRPMRKVVDSHRPDRRSRLSR
jgi:two-component system OmpR family response regulator